MKSTFGIFASFTFALIAHAAIPFSSPAQAVAGAAASNAKWVGVWEGQTRDLLGLTLTLGDDAGEVGGTIVNNVMRDGTIVGHMAHVLLHPHIEGDSLSFQVKDDRNPKELIDMSMEMTGGSAAHLHCKNCGAAFSMTMERIP